MKEIIINIFVRKISLTAAVLFVCAAFSFAQTVRVESKVEISKIKPVLETISDDGTFAEKSIAVDAKVNISLCVNDGKLKITGWDRSEIRAFVNNGSKVSFKVQQKNRQTNAPVWIMVTGFNADNPMERSPEECLSGDEIELDVPRGAVVNVKGRASETKIEAVRKVDVKNVGGSIFLKNIEHGINAVTYQGDVMVENSGGAIALETTNGSVVAFDVAPSEIGDIFKAKTISGTIILERIEHRQTEIGSHSGSIKYTGEFQTGGQYSFSTTNGIITLAIPEKSSCKINALYGFGKFSSELKYDVVTEDKNSKTQRLIASMGSGDATINVTTYSGAIRIKNNNLKR